MAICYGLVEGQQYDWGTITGFVSIPLVLGLGVVLLLAFLLVQRLTQDKEPLVPFALFRDRNYAVVNWVSGVLSVGMMGIFIPLTIYLQSVLGFSALKAGLTMAPASLVSMFVAPVAGRMTDKIGGKFILMSGLILFGAGGGAVCRVRPGGIPRPFGATVVNMTKLRGNPWAVLLVVSLGFLMTLLSPCATSSRAWRARHPGC